MGYDARLVEARLALNQIGYSELPALAVEALEAGLDGPAIRRMAALVNPSGYETDQLLARFVQDAHLAKIAPAEACTRLAVALASELLGSNRDPIPYLGYFERWYMLADYPAEFQELGLIEEDAFVHEYIGDSPTEIRAWVEERLRDFVAANAVDAV